jgi:glycosyltransferase involved in cell wall biosynthesis
VDKTFDAELVVAWQVPHSKIPVYMNACNALLFVSMYEGSPNVVKEALACNLPVVSVSVGDVPERLAGISGCVVSADDDPNTLARAIEQVLRSDRRVDGRASVSELNEELLARRMIQIYESAIDVARGDRRYRSGSVVARA